MSYTAAVLTEDSQAILSLVFGRFVPQGWKKLGHHLTINMGGPKSPEILGREIKLEIVSLAKNDRVIAVGVGGGGEISLNKIPHITLAVNDSIGARPKESNELENWNPITDFELSPLFLNAVVQRCD